MKESNDLKKRITDAIISMSDQQVGKVNNEARINLEKEKFDFYKSCQDNKESRKQENDNRKNDQFEKRLTFKANVFDDNRKQRKLALLKEARESVVEQICNTTDIDIKTIFKEELVAVNAMYRKALLDY